jgi:hypothetical protein
MFMLGRDLNEDSFQNLGCVSDWSIIMIGQGGLLLVVPHLFAVPVLVSWVGFQTSKT